MSELCNMMIVIGDQEFWLEADQLERLKQLAHENWRIEGMREQLQQLQTQVRSIEDAIQQAVASRRELQVLKAVEHTKPDAH